MNSQSGIDRSVSGDRGTVVVWGLLASMPFGGMIWQVLHHLEGFRRLGFDVWYVEDSEIPCMHPETWERVGSYDDTIEFLRRTMNDFGFGDRWVFRPPGLVNDCVGARNLDGLARLYEDADVVFNLCGANRVRPEHAIIKRLVMLQTDPVEPQIDNAGGNPRSIDYHRRHGYLFTYAENIGKPGCLIPEDGFKWIRTRPPIVTDWWASKTPPEDPLRWTTIANWNPEGKDAEWKGMVLRWSKSIQFEKLAGLPLRSKIPFELALARIDTGAKHWLEHCGWVVTDAKELSKRERYRGYIQKSFGEFTPSKENVVKTWSGWFSDRSACYLAAGRPVVTQDTGFGDVLPTGKGLVSFTDEDEAAEAVETVRIDYPRHAAAAREIAREYFDAERVLEDIVRHLDL